MAKRKRWKRSAVPARLRRKRGISRFKRKLIARKIRVLMREGYPQRQAIAIAMRMAGVPRKRKHGKSRRRARG